MGDRLPVCTSGHVEHEVLECRGLRDLPVDTGWHQRLIVVCSRERHFRHVKHEVANVAEELILIDVPGCL